MLRRLLIVLGLLALFCPLGCNTNRPYIYSWPHWKRRIRTVMDDFHRAHMSFDRIVFDMEERPIEEP